ncbi:hypothetical protein [Polyangium fumosum]|uniref:Uncharacterized protein n=1 Tax=Polyangium fumosum TaxID=889272 RepID=A0A4U1JKT0_9BACT|nr:hypothetical protein [Polyangium fumosum]TKD12645.1 hypothetical protein E8A74_02510 [Polyangium fumosum]
MKKVLLALVFLASLGSTRPGCGPYRPERDRSEDEAKKPLKVQEHCKKPSHECFYSCFRREARYSCAECCHDNTISCDVNEKYDFAACELIDPAPASPADAGPTHAPAPPSASTK